MFEKPFSNDADKLLGLAYGIYLQKRKSGKSKFDSIKISSEEQNKILKSPSWNEDDFFIAIHELSEAKFIRTYATGGFDLTTNTIVYMENKPREVISEIVNTVSKFLPKFIP